MCRHVLLDQIEKIMVRPHSKHYEVPQVWREDTEDAGTGRAKLEEPEGVLSLTLVEAAHLVNTDSRTQLSTGLCEISQSLHQFLIFL